MQCRFYGDAGPNKGAPRGIIDLSLEVGDFRKLVHDMVVGKTGYGFITSGRGGIISHPINDYIGKVTLDDLISDPSTPDSLLPVYKGLKAGKSGSLSFFDALSDDTAVVYYGHIGGGAGWGYALVFLQSDLMAPKQALERRKIRLALALAAFVVMLTALYFSRDMLDRREIDELSWISSALILANIFYIAALEHSSTNARPAQNSAPIVDLES